MSEIPVISQSFADTKIKVCPGSSLVINLLINSQIAENLLFRPTLDDWLIDNSKVISISSSISPPYLYVVQGSQVSQKITVSIPSILQNGQKIKSWLRFPAIQEEAIPIELEIGSPETEKDKNQAVEVSLQDTFPTILQIGQKLKSWLQFPAIQEKAISPQVTEKDKNQIIEVSLPVNLPFPSRDGNLFSNALDKSTAVMFGLMSGLIDLDKIPSRWLVAELLVRLSKKGEEYAQTEPGRQLLNQIKPTSFFQNGVIAFASARIPNWIGDSIKSENTILGGQSFLDIWEKWLLNLLPAEQETLEKKRETSGSGYLAENYVAKLGGSADRWFAGILLGLAQISPLIAKKLQDIASKEPKLDSDACQRIPFSDRATEATQSLLAVLPGLDTLPARWLVIELLLLLCQEGDKYSYTEAGSQLLTQLSSTRFYQHGVLAFAAAEAPRWLVITQEAASAYQNSVGGNKNQGGLLNLASQWLWSLGAADLNESQPNSDFSVSGEAVDALKASLRMDAESWFSRVVLGLALVLPRIAPTWDAIASSMGVPSILPTPSPQTIINDIFFEAGSLQR